MSREAIAHLVRLTGAARVPTASLYDGNWPGPLRRCRQIAVNGFEWFRSGGTFVALHGRGVPAAVGPARADGVLSMRSLMNGSYVLRGAQLAGLAQRLAVDTCTHFELFLATEDVLVVFGRRSGLELVIHVSAMADHLDRHRQGLERARESFARYYVAKLIPQVLEMRLIERAQALVQERIAGRIVDPVELSERELEAHIEAALQPLLHLRAAACSCATGVEHDVITDRLRELEEHPTLGTCVSRPLSVLRAWIGSRHHDGVFAHGDYWFRNLLFAEDGSARVVGIVDWERFRNNALVGSDALYLLAFSLAQWRSCDVFQVLCDIWDDAYNPLLARLVRRVCGALEISVDDLRHVAILMWLMHLRLRVPTMVDWPAGRFGKWVTAPADSVARWLQRTTA